VLAESGNRFGRKIAKQRRRKHHEKGNGGGA
jgi:hypothetical protein